MEIKQKQHFAGSITIEKFWEHKRLENKFTVTAP